MMHDIAGKCHIPLFNDRGMIETRIRKLRFSDKKPSLSYFEVPITDICNLNCKGCLFASNLVQKEKIEHVSFTELEQDAKRMSELFYDIPWIRILGGEPLMHPDIIEIFKSYRKYFPDSEIDLCTNGLLIPKMSREFWDTVKQERISIHISGYKPVYHMLDKIDKILKAEKIPYAILKREKFLKYYTKKAEEIQPEFIDSVLGSKIPLTAGDQKTSFQTIVSDTLGDNCNYETVRNIHDNICEMLEETKESPDPLELSKPDVKRLLERSGVPEENLKSFDSQFEDIAGEQETFLASNIVNTKTFQLETPDIVIKVNPERSDLVEIKEIEGRKCLVVAIDEHLEVNGIEVR